MTVSYRISIKTKEYPYYRSKLGAVNVMKCCSSLSGKGKVTENGMDGAWRETESFWEILF